MGYEKNRELKTNSNDFDLSHWKMELPSLTREGCRCRRFGRDKQFCVEHAEFEMSVRDPSEGISSSHLAIWVWSLS